MNHKFHHMFAIFLLFTLLPACTAPKKPVIQLSPCQVGSYQAECGKLRVFENRATKKGRSFNLNLAVIRASSQQKAPDAVFLLSGGPGVAATQDNGMIFLVSMLGERDVVLVDQRGTGGSHAVDPPKTPDWSNLDPTQLEKAYAKWLKKTLPTFDADPRYYTTSVAMDDLDDVRQALGYDKIDLIGGSYGTTAAQSYLRQHEEHVRSVVLISGSVGNFTIWEHQAANAQNALDATFTRCESDQTCHTAFPNVRAEFNSLMENLGAQPVTIETVDGKLELTSELFAAKVEDMLRDAQSAARLPRLIHRAYAEDDWLVWGSASYGDWRKSIMSYSIQCNEPWASFSPEQTARLGQGSFLLGWNLNRASSYSLLCKYLPPGVNPEGQSDQPSSQVPVLLFNGEFDPLDPPANVARAKDIWPNSLVLTMLGQGHSISGLASSCVMQITRQFIQAGSIADISTVCLQDIHAPAFLVP